ncbi:hypothetical protein Lser_V15G18598 [Lactuca serriola]
MVAGISRSPTTLIIVISLTILLLWYTTTTTTIIFWQPPPTVKANHIVKEKQQDQHYKLTRRVLINRKVLSPTTNFDFTPFLHGDHHQHHQHPAAVPEIDPRYGVEMRLVPTGPNPLHH